MKHSIPNWPPYFVWREGGRGRWNPAGSGGRKARALGFQSQDLKDETGAWLGLEAAMEAARALNAAVAAAGSPAAAPAATGLVRTPRRQVRLGKDRTVADLLAAFQASPDFARRPANTQQTYRSMIRAICFEPWAGDWRTDPRAPTQFSTEPAVYIKDHNVKKFFENGLSRRGLNTARLAVMALSAAYKWARLDSDWQLAANPCRDLSLPKTKERVRIASQPELLALIEAADRLGRPSIGDAIYLGVFTGQREADILALVELPGANRSLPDALADGEAIPVNQGKTGANINAWPLPQLVARLRDAERRREALLAGEPISLVEGRPVVLCETTKRAWGQNHFIQFFGKVRALAAIRCPTVKTLQFRDLRDTAITWMARGSATTLEIKDISGHTLGSINKILDAYVAYDGTMGQAAIRKMGNYLQQQGSKL